MHKKFHHPITIAFILLIIDATQIKPWNAMAQNWVPDVPPGSPIVILLDNSGSMGNCVPLNSGGCSVPELGKTRIDIIKKLILTRVTQTDLARTRIGLVEMGDYKRQGLPKEKACDAVETLLLPSDNSRNKFAEALQRIQPNDYGATPIANAIEHTATQLQKKALLPARILLITDGQPNCNQGISRKNICQAVRFLATEKIAVKIDIVGYKAENKDNEFRECAEKYPGVIKYWGPFDNPTEVADAIDKSTASTPSVSSNLRSSNSPNNSDDSGKLSLSIISAICGAIAGKIFDALWMLYSNRKNKNEEFILRILDAENDRPINGSKVSVDTKGIPIVLYTDSEGLVGFIAEHSPTTIRVRAAMDNYKTETRLIRSSTEVQEIKLTAIPNSD
jgi:von Willebrand factor type A domain